MNIFALSKSPKTIATELADLHLVPMLDFAARILNIVAHKSNDKEVVCLLGPSGMPHYSVRNIPLLLPTLQAASDKTSTGLWIKWALESYHNTLWLRGLVWFLGKERMERFGQEIGVHPLFARVDEWSKSEILRAHPKREKKEDSSMEAPKGYPITPEILPYIKESNGDANTAYCKYYYRVLKH